jgi:hypothetical protein
MSESKVLQEFFEPSVLEFHKIRCEHFDSLLLPCNGKTLLEPGSGPGIFGKHFSTRGYNVIALEGRQENVDYYVKYNPSGTVKLFDLESQDWSNIPQCDVSASYGILYHLQNPLQFILRLKEKVTEFSLIDTIVSLDTVEEGIHSVSENSHSLTQSVRGHGCRPTRKLLWNYLKENFQYVYMPFTQPKHIDYPLDFKSSSHPTTRCIFIASHVPLDLPTLSSNFVETYTHDY